MKTGNKFRNGWDWYRSTTIIRWDEKTLNPSSQPARSKIYYCIKWSRWVLMIWWEIQKISHPHHQIASSLGWNTNFIRKLCRWIEKYRRGPENRLALFIMRLSCLTFITPWLCNNCICNLQWLIDGWCLLGGTWSTVTLFITCRSFIVNSKGFAVDIDWLPLNRCTCLNNKLGEIKYKKK